MAAVTTELQDTPSNTGDTPLFADVLEARLSRRRFLAASAALLAASPLGLPRLGRAAGADLAPSSLGFAEVPHLYDDHHHVPDGYVADVLIRWGDPVVAGAPAFDPKAQSAAAQALQFGYNNDFLATFPLPATSPDPDRALLCVNHEYTLPHLMFPGFADDKAAQAGATREQVEIELAAHGLSVVELARTDGRWTVVAGSPLNRRLTLWQSPFVLSGPVAGHDAVKTADDPTGTRVVGTINNCSGGWTPWGTCLSAEENFHQYFSGKPEDKDQARYGIKGKPEYPHWARHFDRFDVTKVPNEPNRFGWVVEIDPYDPASVPRKRTALGRFKHENATTALAADGRVAVYSGDDERFEYVYRFVTAGRYNPDDRAANADLLDDGTLSVARFNADGTLDWLPLIHGQGPLTAENGFASQADILLKTRKAADLLGPTRMDRPEDIETNPVTGKVYLALTKNDKRSADEVDAANQRHYNLYGHLIEMTPPAGADGRSDHGADQYRWDVFLRGGNPQDKAAGAKYGDGTSAAGWFANPDNVAFDSRGRLWILTDGFPDFGVADGVWCCDTDGEARARTRHFFACPRGAEMCGGAFSADDAALFLSVQHPGEEDGSSFDAPAVRWPDFRDDLPPRPAVVVVRRDDGGPIGS